LFFCFWIFLIVILSNCGGGKKSGSPPGTGNAILPLAPKAEAPVILVPETHPYSSGHSTLAIAGSCTVAPGAKVFLGGDEDQVTDCSSKGDYSFAVERSNDGTFNYTLKETSLTLHPSDDSILTWTRDTSPPTPPSISTPTSYPFTTRERTLNISGSCHAGYLVSLTGDITGDVTCSPEGNFSLSLSRESDGTYILEFSQINYISTVSEKIKTSWTIDSSLPTTPVITSPNSNPYISSDSNLLIVGTCSEGSTIKIAGSTTDSTGCIDNSFNFSIEANSYGAFNYSIYAINVSGGSSTATILQWTRDSSVPASPVISSPVTTTVVTNTNSLNINGSCVDGNTVVLSGQSSNSNLCSGSSFSFNVSAVSNGTYVYSVLQKTPSNISSGAVGITWIRDATPPLAPLITSPLISPFYSNSDNLSIAGTCETGARVRMDGDFITETICLNSKFNFSITKSNASTYNFALNQTDNAGNTSVQISFQWILDKTAPPTPLINSPAGNPIISNASSLTISGSCEGLNVVNLTGSESASVACSGNTFSFSINKISDAVFDFSVRQTDIAGNISLAATKQWVRDTAAPQAPIINAPSQNPFTSSDTNLEIVINCENGAIVSYTGAATDSQTCTNTSISFTLNKTSDGTYNYIFNQTDAAGNTSANTNFQWTRDSTVPTTPTITAPAKNPRHTNTDNINIAGTCTDGHTVLISGASSQTFDCTASNYSFTVASATDAIHNFYISQVSATQISSATINFTWIRDTLAPAELSVTSPTADIIFNSDSSFSLKGGCESDAMIYYNGAVSGSLPCAPDNTFSILFNKNTDGIYDFSIFQTDLASNNSASTQKIWIRDTLQPATPIITQPNTNPFTSGNSNFNIIGTCETDSQVTLTGAANKNSICSGSGTFNFDFSATTNGIYDFSVYQTDQAGNISGSTNFQLIRDNTTPFSPVITQPLGPIYYANSNSLNLIATCDSSLSPSAAIIHLSGDVASSDISSPINTLDQNCITSPSTYTINKLTDGTYILILSQENPNNSLTSPASTVTWIRDTLAPIVPVISTPNPYTAPGNLIISGNCELGATVYLTGDATQNLKCELDSFSFSVIKSVDATYNFILFQTDLAGNTSTTTAFTWYRNEGSVAPPVILAPANNPLINNQSQLSISGTCSAGYTVNIGGLSAVAGDVSSPSNSLTQICSSSNSFNFVITKNTDGTYSYDLTQTFAGLTSSLVNVTWTRDTVAPSTTIIALAGSPNFSTSIDFNLTASETTVSFQCQLDSGSPTSCSSPVNFSALSNGNHILTVRATDAVGNVGSPATHSWVQAAYNTVTLYHLNAALPTPTPTLDSSLFTSTGAFNNNLTASGSPTVNSQGRLPTSSPSSFSLDTSSYFSVASNNSINSTAKIMTIEGLFYFNSLTAQSGDYYTLFSKTGPTAPDLGWELRLVKSNGSGKFNLKFLSSLDGNTVSSRNSSGFSLNRNTWYYFAMTWNAGAINYYVGSGNFVRSHGTSSIGTVGSAFLFSNNAPLLLGSGPSSGSASSLWLSGSIDEVRISNVLRNPVVPTIEYSPD
jgi:hypothetical protein